MPTILTTIEQTPEEHDLLQDAYQRLFLDGECYAFALALHQGLGWPLVGLIKSYDEKSKRSNLIWHAGVRSPGGRIHDARGFLTDDEFGGYFLSPPFTIREILPNELYATRPIEPNVIGRARRHAETLWPQLPWIDTFVMRVTAFADDLEELSRKHGLWICHGVPADPPRVYTGGGDEGGYRVRPTMDGNTYTITRYFPFEIQMEEAAHAFR
jgi:hypothetical protein